ncbi:hypothetical protein D8Y22_10025 [Salinadaptatus halalkaliphilus]|uniref:Uncharacterized protein n=1 Tax=Salinadaptatus halalkaliphilus TaxID=2419781 RepID=A0A4S3TLJ4_9EURY|nr:hypothetical protein [Salinadaptatus halalkaliphilus]THE65032.1 hypothetical protein D8Y22_10025 [Salinadaptatus halalkaliphilus]
MAGDAIIPRTAIEWYMFGGILVVLNIVGLLLTGHTLIAAVGLGLVSGLTIALLVAVVAAVLRVVRE